MEFPITINDQAGFDELVKSRLERERSKFGDYDDLKGQVSRLQKERDEATANADKAKADLTALETSRKEAEAQAERERQLGQWRKEVATTAGLPEDVLVGSTKEEFESHAATLKQHFTNAPRVPDPGKTPDRNTSNEEMREFTRNLFGHSE